MTGYYPVTDEKGDEVLLLIVKRTYDVDFVEAKCAVAEKQDDVELGDVYNGDEDPFKSSVKYESDVMSPIKLKKDIVFNGKAYPPGKKPSKTWDVSLQVGKYRRALRVFGPRTVTWVPPVEKKEKSEESGGKKKLVLEHQPPIISDPEPIEVVDLTYENAYGGFATYYPEHPDAYRKAVRKAKKKQKKKEKEEKQAAEDKQAAQEEKKKEKAAEEARKKEEAAKKAIFYDGVSDIEDAPDVELEVELGSTKKKAADGTMVLDLAELAEVEEREAAEAAAERADAELAKISKEARHQATDGALLADEEELAKLAAEMTDEALEEQTAYQKKARQEGVPADGATRAIDLADMGDEVMADDDWVEEQRQERADFYESLGLDPDEEIEWMDGEFPRIPCPTNYLGKGFALRNCKESLDGLEMPLIEDPNRLLQPEDLPIDPATLHLPTLPIPAGFGFYARPWVPRAYLAGLTPDEIEEAQHKLDQDLTELDPDDPDDEQVIRALIDREAQELDPLYYNGAHPGWQVDELWGDEEIYLDNLTENGKSFFKLPGVKPYVRFDRGEGWERIDVDLDTLVIDAEEAKVNLVWRGRVAYGGIDELTTYPRVDIDVQDFTVAEFRDQIHKEQIEAARRRGQALKLGVDEIGEDEAAEFERRIEQKDIGMHGIKEERSTDAREVRAKDGALIDIQDREDVIMVEDGWVEQTQLEQMSDEERKKLELERDERKRVQEKKKELKQKLEQKDKERAEEEERKAKEKKKKKKEEEKPAEEDDEDELDDEDDLDEGESGESGK